MGAGRCDLRSLFAGRINPFERVVRKGGNHVTSWSPTTKATRTVLVRLLKFLPNAVHSDVTVAVPAAVHILGEPKIGTDKLLNEEQSIGAVDPDSYNHAWVEVLSK